MSWYPIPKREYGREQNLARYTKRDPTIRKILAKDLVMCPRHCTQRRTRRNRLSERKTFDPITNKCRNCGFSKMTNYPKPQLKKASEL